MIDEMTNCAQLHVLDQLTCMHLYVSVVNLKQKQGTFTECAKLLYDTCINKCADNIFWDWAIHILFYHVVLNRS